MTQDGEGCVSHSRNMRREPTRGVFGTDNEFMAMKTLRSRGRISLRGLMNPSTILSVFGDMRLPLESINGSLRQIYNSQYRLFQKSKLPSKGHDLAVTKVCQNLRTHMEAAGFLEQLRNNLTRRDQKRSKFLREYFRL